MFGSFTTPALSPATIAARDAAIAAQGGAETAREAAEAARDIALAAGDIYADTTAGLAAVAVGGYFTVPSSSSTGYLDLYRVDAGPVATLVKSYALVDALEARTITGGGLATGGGDLTADRVLTVERAGPDVTIAGTSTTTVVTPADNRAALDHRLMDVRVRAVDHDRYSHIFHDGQNRPLVFVLRDGGGLDFAVSDDLAGRLRDMIGGWPAGAVVETTDDSGWRFVIRDPLRQIVGGWTREGDLVARLDDRSIIPGSVVHAAVIDLFASARAVPPSGRLFFSGDSLTAGAGGGGITYPAVMAAALGLPYVNTGVGGTGSSSIAVRQGGLAMLVSLADGLIPAAAVEVDITSWSAEITNDQSSQTWSCNLAGVAGVARRYGTAENAAVTQKYTFTRQEVGDAVPVPDGTRLNLDIYDGNDDDFHYIQSGRNNAKSTHAQRIVVRDHVLSMIDRLRHDRFGVLAVKTGSGEGSGTASYDYIMDINRLLADAVGMHHFADTRSYLASTDALADCGIAATADDLEAIANDTVPPSLLADTPHGNASYYTAEGLWMARWHRGHAY